MAILVTGAAGFVGFHTTNALLDRGEQVIGVDNLNAYYAPSLKQARLDALTAREGFDFVRLDIAEHHELVGAVADRGVDRIVHLAAQAGVRYSLENPFAYAKANLVGHLSILELARTIKPKHLVYASSSSVYGGNTKIPFAETDMTDDPASLYGATKKADELMSQSYARLYGLPVTGLRFFTVYGPWGRPDMAYWIFTKAILEGRPIRLFNQGQMGRDFTYIDDCVAGVIAALDQPPADRSPSHRVYNLGNNHPEELLKLVQVLEGALGREAEKTLEPMQPGDVERTWADPSRAEDELGFSASTSLEEGLAKFVAWYQEHGPFDE
ncbi:MAG: NAD-dependent epimerase/dehydratase family protein [Pseudomonadota bacterium]